MGVNLAKKEDFPISAGEVCSSICVYSEAIFKNLLNYDFFIFMSV